MTAVAELLLPEEKRALRPPDRLAVSEWADRHRVLDPIHCAQPGPWSTDTTPYLREVMDAYGDRRTRALTLMCSTQVGKTELLINCFLWQVEQDPVPVLWVMPTEEDVLSFRERRLAAAVDACEVVSARRSEWKRDDKQTEIGFEGMVAYFAWSNSPSRLASRSIGRLYRDEVDKMPAFSGREADPLSLSEERLRWYFDAKVLDTSTPTTQEGYIWQRWEASSREWFNVPCPFCGVFQPLKFSMETVKWPKDERDPTRMRRHRLAVYVCSSCKREIPDDDDHKRRMLLAGVWCPEAGKVDAGGKVHGARETDHRGFHVNALYSPVLSWSDVAAKFLEAKDDVAKLMNFTNSWLGWPWVEKSASLSTERLSGRALVQLPAGTVPQGTIALTGGGDVQEREVFFVVRAHLGGARTVTIHAARIESLEALAEVIVHGSWPVEGDPNTKLQVRLLCLDSGYRTDEVYDLCSRFPDVLRATKGHQHREAPFSAVRVERDWIGRARGLALWHVDTSFYKDRLARQMLADLGVPGSWAVHANPSEEYLRHLTSEHRVLVRSKKTKRTTEEWTPRPSGGPNHWWDAEVLAEVAGDMIGIYAIRDAREVAPVAPQSPPPRERRSEERYDDRDRGERRFSGGGEGRRRWGDKWIRRPGRR